MQIGGLCVVAFGLKLECIICFVLQKYLYTEKGVVNGMKLFAATPFQRAGQSLFAVFQLDIVDFILLNKNNFSVDKNDFTFSFFNLVAFNRPIVPSGKTMIASSGFGIRCCGCCCSVSEFADERSLDEQLI